MNAICTIINRNYLPQALAQHESLKSTNPASDYFLLITDGVPKNLVDISSARLLEISDLDIQQEKLDRMSSYYDGVEFATAMKPSLLKQILRLGYSSVTFIDPDTLVLDNLELAQNLAASHDIVLTPHRISPGHANSSFSIASEIAFLKYGIYNLGFISVGQGSLPMLNWWEEKLEIYCSRKSNLPIYTDQKWIDLVPSYYKHFILRSPAYNLAYWNIDERDLEKRQNSYFVSGEPLVFIHFSQMSSRLAKGLGTPLWAEAFSGKQTKSFDLISDITESYVVQLSKFKSILMENKVDLIANSKIANQPASGRFSQRFRMNSPYGNFGIFKSLIDGFLSSNFVRNLERSETLVGMFEGLIADLKRSTLKLKRRKATK